MEEQQSYYYEPKGDHLTVFKGKKKAHTPNGSVIIAENEGIARQLIKELEGNADYTSCATMLCYHYTYCDLISQYDLKTVAKDLTTCCQDNLEDDPIVLFHQEIPDADEETTEKIINNILSRLQQNITAHIAKCDIYQLVAMIVLYCSFDSLALSYYIIKDIIEKSPDAEASVANKEAFVAELKSYCEAEEIECPDDINDIIDTFVNYYTQASQVYEVKELKEFRS